MAKANTTGKAAGQKEDASAPELAGEQETFLGEEQDLEKPASEARAESLETTNTDTVDAPADPSQVYVFANLKQAISFRLAKDEVVTIKGLPVSSLKKPDGGFFAGGKYGVTVIPARQWARIMELYGNMAIFLNGLVFAAVTLERGKAMARERGGLRYGYEPVDPESKRAKTFPKTED